MIKNIIIVGVASLAIVLGVSFVLRPEKISYVDKPTTITDVKKYILDNTESAWADVDPYRKFDCARTVKDPDKFTGYLFIMCHVRNIKDSEYLVK